MNEQEVVIFTDSSDEEEKLKGSCNEHFSAMENEKFDVAYTWTVYDLEYLFKTSEQSFIASPRVISGSTGDFEWDINLYLFDDSDYVNVSIFSYDCDGVENYLNIVAKSEISIINKHGEKVNVRTKKFEWEDKNWIFENFIKRDDLYNAAKGYVNTNKLTLHCRICISSHHERFDEDKDLDFQITQSKLQVSRDLKLLLTSNDFSDIVFYVQEKEFSAHKAILASRSPIFVAMFENEMLEKVENKVYITDVSSGTFDKLLQFIYSGTLQNIDNLSKNDLTELLVAAEKYQIEDLKEICAVVFYNTLSTSNAIELLIIADTYNIDSLKDQIIEYILAHKKDITSTPEYESFTMSHSHLLAKFIDMCNIHSGRVDEFRNNFIYTSFFSCMIIPIEERHWGVTQTTVDECCYTWQFDNIGFLLSEKSTTDDFIISTKIFSDNDVINQMGWQLVVYPNGIDEKATGYLSLFLQCFFRYKNEKIEKVQAQYNLEMIDKSGSVIKSVKSNVVKFKIEPDQVSNRQGEAKFLERKCFFEDQFKESINDTLTIKCNITYSFGCYDNIQQGMPMNYSLTEYLLNVSYDLKKLFTSTTLSDMTIKCKDKKFKLHRLILSIRCPLLLSMLNQLSKNETDDCIDISDLTEPNVFEELLRYVYSGNANNMQNLAKDLYCEANKYQLEDLKNLCEKHLCNNITVENVCDYLVFAHTNRACKLKNKTTQCIVDKISTISKTTGYLSLSSSKPNLLKDVIRKLKMLESED